jgi:glucosylceramidase
MVGGKCLDVYFASRDNGASVVTHDCNWGWNQMWWMDSLGRLRPLHAWWKCADIRGGDWGWGARIQLWDCHGGPNQQWALGEGACRE